MRFLLVPAALLASFIFTTGASAAGEPILPLSQVTPGMSCTAKSVLSGTTPTEFPVTIKDVYRDGSGAFLLVEVSGAAEQSGIAAGMSGSPVYCPSVNGPAITGALSYGIGEWGDKVGLATPIEAMLGQKISVASYDKAPKVVSQAVREGKSREPVYLGGVSKYAFNWLSGRNPSTRYIAASSKSGIASATLGASTVLNPGDSIGVFNVGGDINMGGIGTVTYRDDNQMWAFGHPWYDSGARSTWISEAPITTIVNNGKDGVTPSYKLGNFGPTIGKLDYDGPYAVSGVFGQEPASFDVSTNVSGPGLQTASVRAQIADESALGWPGDNPTDLASALTNIEAVTDSFSGTLPNGMTLDACWSIRVRTIEKPFSFCQKYAGMVWDGQMPAALLPVASNNLAITPIVEQASFANLRIENITTSIEANRGGQLAKMQKAKQSGKSSNVVISYLNNAGETKAFTVKLPKIKNKKGKTLKLAAQTSGDQSLLVTNIPIAEDNSSQETAEQPTSLPQITSEEEMRSLFKSFSGVNKLAGRVGKKRFSVSLPKDFVALPVGKVSTRLR